MLKYNDLAFHSPKLRARMVPGWELDYFNSKEWLNVQDRLDERDRERLAYTPRRSDLFRALSLCSWGNCCVVFVGQDPYPNPSHATGVAFSIQDMRGSGHARLDLGKTTSEEGAVQSETLRVPPSLHTIFKELVNDVQKTQRGTPIWPKTGCLESWCRQGVLLWNAMPVYPPLEDFTPLTQEIIERLSAKGKIVFVFCGRKAQKFHEYVDHFNNVSIFVSHPSPRGQLVAKDKFIGSRVFSRINDHLNSYLKEPIDWTI